MRAPLVCFLICLFIGVNYVLSASIPPEELFSWVAKSLFVVDKCDFKLHVSYDSTLKVELELQKNSHLYLLLKDLKSKTLFINLGFFKKGKHTINVDLESNWKDSILLVQIFSCEYPLLTSERLENESDIFNFLSENVENLRTAWQIVFKCSKNAILKLYSNHGKKFIVMIDGKTIGETPISMQLTPGIHRLIFKHGTKEWSKILCLQDSEIREIDLSDYIHDGDCKVEVDFESIDNLKFDFNNIAQKTFTVPKGAHTLEIFEGNMLVFLKNMKLTKDIEKISPPKLGLSSILLKTNPGAMIFLNGSFKGLSGKNGTFFIESLTWKIAVVKITKSGYLSEEFPVVLKPGINIVKRPLLELESVLIKTNVKPVKIFLDGKYLDTINRETQYVSLPKGEHTLRFENSCCYTIQETLDISERSEINLFFHRLPLYLYIVVSYDEKDMKMDLIASEDFWVNLYVINKERTVFKKRKLLKEGHNYFEIRNPKEGSYLIKIIAEDEEDELKVHIEKGVKFEIKKLLTFFPH